MAARRKVSTTKARGARYIASDLAYAARKLGGPWTLVILRELLEQPRRFGELKKALPFVPARSLVRVLQRLERKEGLVVRTVLPTRPLSVVYSLKKEDPLLREVLEVLSRWGRQADLLPENWSSVNDRFSG